MSAFFPKAVSENDDLDSVLDVRFRLWSSHGLLAPRRGLEPRTMTHLFAPKLRLRIKSRMSALGRKQPFRNRAWDSLNDQLSNVCFRPTADLCGKRKHRHWGGVPFNRED
jgi:hypothetical protein